MGALRERLTCTMTGQIRQYWPHNVNRALNSRAVRLRVRLIFDHTVIKGINQFFKTSSTQRILIYNQSLLSTIVNEFIHACKGLRHRVNSPHPAIMQHITCTRRAAGSRMWLNRRPIIRVSIACKRGYSRLQTETRIKICLQVAVLTQRNFLYSLTCLHVDVRG